MAAATSRTRPPALFMLLLSLYYCSIHVRPAGCVSFDIDFATTIQNLTEFIKLEGGASISPPMLELTEAKLENTGRASYMNPVPLWDKVTGEMASFTTTFSFLITPVPTVAKYAGDGMTFFLAPFPSVLPPGSIGGSLGLVGNTTSQSGTTTDDGGPRRFVAVEFDTYDNPSLGDPNNNHIGIDINSVTSTNSTSTTDPTRNLLSGSHMLATVWYGNRTKLLQVDLRIQNITYHVEASVDLSKVLPVEVAVGFTAATGSNIELHRILTWSFSSTLEASKKEPAMVAPAPAPAPSTSTLSPDVRAGTSAPAPTPTQKHRNILLFILVPLLSLLVCAAVVGGFLVWWLRIHNHRQANSDPRDSQECERADELERQVIACGPKRYTYRELAAATNNFDEKAKLGRGGFGSVYLGHLTVGGGEQSQSDRPVAIKMLSKESSAQGRKEFEAEVRIISRLSHGNLVQLLGWSDSRDGLLLVYEFVAGGTLDKHLHGDETTRLLTWPERYKIILGLGSSLCYLHGEWHRCVLHGDIKPSNIMLDASYNTKLGDFGLARLIDHGVTGKTTHQVMGTKGYLDPVVYHTYRRSTQSDVYSFGIVLLEIVSGRSPVSGTISLLEKVSALHDRNAILEAAEERLRGDELEEWWMERVLRVGLWCTQREQSDRPSIVQAMDVLKSKDATPPVLPPQSSDQILPPSPSSSAACINLSK